MRKAFGGDPEIHGPENRPAHTVLDGTAGTINVCGGSYGVRIHLLGIQHPGDNQDNQSRLLRQESDTSTEWNRSDIATFLTVQASQEILGAETETSGAETRHDTLLLNSVASDFVQTRSSSELAAISALAPKDGIPGDLDRILLRSGADAFRRFLDPPERARLRQEVRRLVSQTDPLTDHSQFPETAH